MDLDKNTRSVDSSLKNELDEERNKRVQVYFNEYFLVKFSGLTHPNVLIKFSALALLALYIWGLNTSYRGLNTSYGGLNTSFGV